MFALTAARLFDGVQLVDNPLVIIDGSRIASVGATPPDGVEVIDLGDATLLPGLIDCHQHLVFNCQGTLEEQVAGVRDADLLARARANARSALAAGITTIRDVGDKDYVTLELRDDTSLPTILCSGPPLTVVQGHCWYLGGECTPDTIEAAVAEHKERGCDLIKVMVSGGHLTPTFPMHQSQFSTEELRVIVDAAHAAGMPVAAHCHGVDSIESSVEVGVDTIEHCTFFTADGSSHPESDLIARLAASGIALSGTAGSLPGMLPPPVIQANLATVTNAYAEVWRLGGTVVVGTDAGIAPPKPHNVLPHSFLQLVDIGMSRPQALAALTSTAARVIGLGNSKGRLAAGFDADLVAMGGDPVTGDDDLLNRVGVWRAGIRIDA